MTTLNINTIIIIAIIIVLVQLFLKSQNKKHIDHFTDFQSNCGSLPNLLGIVMKNRGMKEDANAGLFIPCSYDSCEKDVLAFENKDTGKKVFIIDGCDWIASKLALWALLKEYFKEDASRYMPTTFLLEDKKDLKEFPEHFDKNKEKRPDQMYVLKNYAQRQEGIKLSRDKDEIMNGLSDGWYLVQDYVYDPFLIDRRKINFRYYMLVTCIDGVISGYLHQDGFLYYTPEYYNEHDIGFDKHITTGYIDRKVYEKNPLTLEDFREHVDMIKKGNRELWDHSANHLMSKVMEAISKKICKNKKLQNHTRFQLFGCDLAPNSTLTGAKLMEINKGPDMDAKDERDKKVKLKVQEDIFKIVDPPEAEPKYNEINNTRFIKIF